MAIRTRPEGLNMGRAYLLHFETRLEMESWLAHIKKSQDAAEREEGMIREILEP